MIISSLTKMFFAISHKNRREIYKLVLNKEKNITEISSELNQKYPNVLKNLKILEEAGLVSFDKRITEKSKETFVRGVPLKKGTVYESVYLKLLEEDNEA